VMLVKDLNDDITSLTELRKLIDQIHADRVYINVPIRPPAESWVEIPPANRLTVGQEILGAYSIAHFEELIVESIDQEAPLSEQLLNIIIRHPLRTEQIYTLFHETNKKEIDSILEQMIEKQLIVPVEYHDNIFWEHKRSK